MPKTEMRVRWVYRNKVLALQMYSDSEFLSVKFWINIFKLFEWIQILVLIESHPFSFWLHSCAFFGSYCHFHSNLSQELGQSVPPSRYDQCLPMVLPLNLKFRIFMALCLMQKIILTILSEVNPKWDIREEEITFWANWGTSKSFRKRYVSRDGLFSFRHPRIRSR